MTDLAVNQPRGQAMHETAENLLAHESARLTELLASHPTVQLHFHPMSGSWLEHVATCQAEIERDRCRRQHYVIWQT